jgi:hypothetical protein
MTTTSLGGTVGRTPDGRSAQGIGRPARRGLGSSTEAIQAFERDGGAIGKEDAMTVASDIIQTWPDAVVDIGPIELTDHYWAIVGSIPYDGHVVLAVIGSPPPRRALHP